VHWHPGDLALDVPERLLESAHRAVKVHRTPPRGEIVEGRLRELLDATRIAVDQVALELIDVRGDLKVAIRLCIALAPAVDGAEGVAGVVLGVERGGRGDGECHDCRSGRDADARRTNRSDHCFVSGLR